MNIIVICHYFAPEPGAPSARWFELTRAWVDAGHTVKVVTCFPNHPTGKISTEYKGRLRSRELTGGVEVYRNWVYATPNEGVIKKTLGHISFMFSSVFLSLFRSGPADIVIVSSPTFFSLFAGYMFSRLKGVPLVVEIRDLWPAAIIELGLLQNRTAIRLLEALELWAYRMAKEVVVVTESFKDNLIRRGVPAGKISVVTNGVDLEQYFPGPKHEGIERELDCQGQTLVLYIGAHGVSQGLDTVVEAARMLQQRTDIVFGFVGEGAAKASLQKRARELQLTNVRFLPAQPKERMPDFYRTSDICLVPLKAIPLFKTFIPSKMFEIMGCGRPMVASLEGESAMILERSGGAQVIPPENAAALVQAIVALVDDEPHRADMARKGADFVAQHYSRRELAGQYESILRAHTAGR